MATTQKKKKKQRCIVLHSRTTILCLWVHLSVAVTLHGQYGAAERSDARDVLHARAALALGSNARSFRADACRADDDPGDLAFGPTTVGGNFSIR